MYFQLRDIEIPLYLGILPKEKRNKQIIKVTLEYQYDTKQANQSDNIEDTINYQNLYDYIKSFPGENHYNLLEKFYHDLWKALKTNFPELKKLALQIEKFPFQSGESVLIKKMDSEIT